MMTQTIADCKYFWSKGNTYRIGHVITDVYDKSANKMTLPSVESFLYTLFHLINDVHNIGYKSIKQIIIEQAHTYPDPFLFLHFLC